MKKTLVGLLLLLTAVLCAWPSINLGGGLRTVGGGAPLTLYDNDNQNIHASYDPLCNPATVDANGITMCVGFEDGMFTPGVGSDPPGFQQNECTEHNGTSPIGPLTTLPVGCTCRGGCAYSNYWWDKRNWSFNNIPGSAIYKADPQRTHWTRCATDAHASEHVGDADRGVAGTNCTATMGWYDSANTGQEGRVQADRPVFTADGTPNTNHPTSGFDHFYFRGYIRHAGTISDECPLGYPNCPSARVSGTDYVNTGLMSKGFEFIGAQDEAGVSMFNLASNPGGAFMLGRSSCTLRPNYEVPEQGTNSGQFLRSFPPLYTADPPTPGAELRPIPDYENQWIFFEFYIKVETSFAASDGVYKFWTDACGIDGRSCTGTPTLRANYTGIRIGDYNPDGPGGCQQPVTRKRLWVNFFSNFPQVEYQLDELIVRDADVVNDPIGFAPVIN